MSSAALIISIHLSLLAFYQEMSHMCKLYSPGLNIDQEMCEVFDSTTKRAIQTCYSYACIVL